MYSIDPRRELEIARAYVAEAKEAVAAIDEQTPADEAESRRHFLAESLRYEQEVRAHVLSRTA